MRKSKKRFNLGGKGETAFLKAIKKWTYSQPVTGEEEVTIFSIPNGKRKLTI
jgi:hypothetical protein